MALAVLQPLPCRPPDGTGRMLFGNSLQGLPPARARHFCQGGNDRAPLDHIRRRIEGALQQSFDGGDGAALAKGENGTHAHIGDRMCQCMDQALVEIHRPPACFQLTAADRAAPRSRDQLGKAMRTKLGGHVSMPCAVRRPAGLPHAATSYPARPHGYALRLYSALSIPRTAMPLPVPQKRGAFHLIGGRISGVDKRKFCAKFNCKNLCTGPFGSFAGECRGSSNPASPHPAL